MEEIYLKNLKGKKKSLDIKNTYVENWNPFSTSTKVHSCIPLGA